MRSGNHTITARGIQNRVKKYGGYTRGAHRRVGRELEMLVEAGEFRFEETSIEELAVGLIPHGSDYVRACKTPGRYQELVEAGDAVDSTAFLNITGQLIINEVLAGFELEKFVASQLIPDKTTTLSGELIPGITQQDDDSEIVGEGMPFPHQDVGEEFIETPKTTKRGKIIGLTREAVFFDRTGLLIDRAMKVGVSLGLNKEKRLIDLIIGATNNYKRNGTNFNTYQTATPWINKKALNDLENWEDIDASEQLLADITDPNTGEVVMAEADQIFVTSNRRAIGSMIIGATEVRDKRGGAEIVETITSNPVTGYQLISSRLLKRRIIDSGVEPDAVKAGKYWFHGDFGKAFAYMVNWPITVVQEPQNSIVSFERDIIMRWKASERGAAAVIEPRVVVLNFED